MGILNRIDRNAGSIVSCDECGKLYNQVIEEQTPGCKSLDYDMCPYCNHCNGRSVSEEYYNTKI